MSPRTRTTPGTPGRRARQGAKDTILKLPFELRDKILSYILIRSSTYDHLSWLKGSRVNLRSPVVPYNQQHSRQYRRMPPYLNDQELSKRFQILCRVSKTMRLDAINVLFYHNPCELNIELIRDHTSNYSRVGQFVGWNSAAVIEKLWGSEAILSIRDITIVVKNGNKWAEKRMEKLLQSLAEVLTKSKCLRSLRLEWKSHYGLDALNGSQRGDSRNIRYSVHVLGSKTVLRLNAWDKNGMPTWAGKAEKILEPFSVLRRVSNAYVFGCVSDAYAQYLERCMTSDLGPVPRFERQGDAGGSRLDPRI